MARVSKDKKDIIRRATLDYERRCEDLQQEMVFELSMQLKLEEETVCTVWDEVAYSG